MIAIKIQELSKRFGETVALDHVSLQIQPGELFFLLGPSGCGKTTLLRHLAGFVQQDEGRIFFDNDDVGNVPPHRRNVGMMFQSYALWPHMTVAENVAFGLEERRLPRREIHDRVREALEGVRMGDYGARKINQLSGGQQQRVALARALVIRPRCLLLDEPLSNLDAKLRLEMRSEIRRICKEHQLTAVYVTHDQKEALSVADTICIMDAGKVIQVGSPRDIYRRPLTQTVADFIGETNFIPGTVSGVMPETRTARVETSIGSFEATISDSAWVPSSGQGVVLSIRPENWTLHQEKPPINSLTGSIGESIYLGESAQYSLESDGMHIKVIEFNPHFAPDDKARILHASVKPEDAVVLKA